MESRTEKKSRFRIERLEERIAPSQVGSVISLPPSADVKIDRVELKLDSASLIAKKI